MLHRLPIARDRFEDVMRKRLFYTPAFEIYGGSSGLYDYGPPGCAIMANLIQTWRQHFILEDSLLEIDTTCVTPGIVLETSGHVARFKDFMVRDLTTGTFYRADHLLEDRMEKLLSDPNLTPEQIMEYTQVKTRADDFNQDELATMLVKYAVTAPTTPTMISSPSVSESGAPGQISSPFPFNLMFQTTIGPSQTATGYLRPETAQGIFVNFAKLLDYNGGKIPFGAATIGRAFRNEISPRQGLLRVREFTLAEIEYFVHPNNKDHDRFDAVRSLRVNLFSRAAQLVGSPTYRSITLGDAVDTGIINNQTLGYYIGRCYLFLIKIGARPEWIRFRQHLANEMAHYATDCWDAELLTTYGWIECVGNADRACYDLTVHARASKQNLGFWEQFDEPHTVSKRIPHPNKRLIGQHFKDTAPRIFEALSNLSEEEVERLSNVKVDASTDVQSQAPPQLEISRFQGLDSYQLMVADQVVILSQDMLQFEMVESTVYGHYLTPSVIEPSYGLGRIMYAVLEQSYYQRAEDLDRGVLRLNSTIAPVRCAVFPLMVKPELIPMAQRIHRLVIEAGISCKLDLSSGSIGKHYSKADELGIPFAITVDYESLDDATVTIRDRDSMLQTRVPIDRIVATLQ